MYLTNLHASILSKLISNINNKIVCLNKKQKKLSVNFFYLRDAKYHNSWFLQNTVTQQHAKFERWITRRRRAQRYQRWFKQCTRSLSRVSWLILTPPVTTFRNIAKTLRDFLFWIVSARPWFWAQLNGIAAFWGFLPAWDTRHFQIFTF